MFREKRSSHVFLHYTQSDSVHRFGSKTYQRFTFFIHSHLVVLFSSLFSMHIHIETTLQVTPIRFPFIQTKTLEISTYILHAKQL